MLYRLLLLLLLGLPAGSVAAPVILVLGDSLSAAYGIEQSEGWVHQLRQRLEDRGYPHRVANVSISGETTSGSLSRLDGALEKHRPEIVIVEVGANDGLRGLPLDRIERNLSKIVTTIQERGASAVLAGMQLPPNYGRAYTRGFRRIFEDLAEKHKTGLVPFLLADLEHDGTHFQRDGFHPNASAQTIILDNVWSALEPMLRHRAD